MTSYSSRISFPFSFKAEPSACGYCSQGTSYAYYLHALSLDPSHYQALLDRGWRRSGSLLYLPQPSLSCCPLLPIRTPGLTFSPSSSQKSKWSRFHRRFIALQSSPPFPSLPALTRCSSRSHEFLFGPHFKIVLCEPVFEEASYQLFLDYQRVVHSESEARWSRQAYARFLIESPLTRPRGTHTLAQGSYHMKYYERDTLIAVSVVDLLPTSFSAVYFYHAPHLRHWSLGTLSSLYELALCHSLACHYYSGYYIEHCQKMAYKAQFQPAQWLDRRTYDWREWNEILGFDLASSASPSILAQWSHIPLQIEGQVDSVQAFFLSPQHASLLSLLAPLLQAYVHLIGTHLASHILLVL